MTNQSETECTCPHGVLALGKTSADCPIHGEEPDQEVWDAVHGLMLMLHTLPWADKVEGVPPRYAERDLVAWIKATTVWLAQYQQFASVAKSSAAEMARELTELRDQRAAVQAFLGTNQIGSP